jgi:hypothetical protein
MCHFLERETSIQNNTSTYRFENVTYRRWKDGEFKLAGNKETDFVQVQDRLRNVLDADKGYLIRQMRRCCR